MNTRLAVVSFVAMAFSLAGTVAAQMTVAPAPAAQVSVAAPSMAKPVVAPQVRVTANGSNLNVAVPRAEVQAQQPIRQIDVRSNPPTVIRAVPTGVEIQQENRSQVVRSVVISGGPPPRVTGESHPPHPPHREWQEETRCYLDVNTELKCYKIWVPRN